MIFTWDQIVSSWRTVESFLKLFFPYLRIGIKFLTKWISIISRFVVTFLLSISIPATAAVLLVSGYTNKISSAPDFICRLLNVTYVTTVVTVHFCRTIEPPPTWSVWLLFCIPLLALTSFAVTRYQHWQGATRFLPLMHLAIINMTVVAYMGQPPERKTEESDHGTATIIQPAPFTPIPAIPKIPPPPVYVIAGTQYFDFSKIFLEQRGFCENR